MTAPLSRLSPLSAAAAAVLAVWVGLALFGPYLLDPTAAAIDLARAWRPPSAAHPLGCDGLGRDVLARLILAARTALAVAAPGAALAVAIGGGLGAAAGMLGGRVDATVRHLSEVSLAFPRLILALALGAVLGAGLTSVVVAFALASWPTAALPTRAQTIGLRREAFVQAAAALGGSTGHILRRHILPGLWAGWLARVGGLAAQAIMLEAALGFLGLGAQEPQPGWGGMIRDGLPMLARNPAMAGSAGAAIFIVALAANLTADAAARRLDPRRRSGDWA